MQKWFRYIDTTYSDDGKIVKRHYRPIQDIFIKAIDIVTKKVDYKRVIDFSIHYNLSMYLVEHKYKGFDPFWVSDDHSLIVLDTKSQLLIKQSPKTILEENDPDRYCLVKSENGELTYIPIDFKLVNISYDPMMTEGFDFTVEDYYTFATSDGIFLQDTMACYNVPYHKELNHIYIGENLISPGSLKPLPTLEHEFVLALYQMTVDEPDPDKAQDYDPTKEYNWSDTIRLSDGSITTFGRYFISTNIGVDIRYPLTTKKIRSVLTNLIWSKTYPEFKEILQFLTAQVKHARATLSLEDFEYIRNTIGPIRGVDDPKQFLEILNQKTEQLKEIAPTDIKNIVNSGARGSWEQLRQMTIAKGAISDTSNRIVGIIKHSLLDGLDRDEMFISTYGTRKGLIDKGLETSVTGYTARQLVYALANVLHDPDTRSCGTKKLLPVQLTKDNIKCYLYRYILDPKTGKPILITYDNKDQFINKKVLLFSPIFCKNKHICHLCFGSLYSLIKSRYIGIIAAQSLSERTTQLTLRTFHTSGAVENISDSGTNVDITTYMDQFKSILVNRKMNVLNTYTEIMKIFEQYRLLSVWVELLCRQLYIDKETFKPAALYGYERPYVRLSLKESISAISWFHGLAFENAIKHIKLGLFKDFKVSDPTLFEQLMML